VVNLGSVAYECMYLRQSFLYLFGRTLLMAAHGRQQIDAPRSRLYRAKSSPARERRRLHSCTANNGAAVLVRFVMQGARLLFYGTQSAWPT
jgi:hypothetical protein